MGVVDSIFSSTEQWLQNFILSGQTIRVGQQTTDITTPAASLPHLTQRHVVPAEVADDVTGLAGEGLGAVAGEPWQYF